MTAGAELIQRHMTQAQRAFISESAQEILYSDKYTDDEYEYRHAVIPRKLFKIIPPGLLTEDEWRAYGINQSLGWEHCMRHASEARLFIFRRKLDA